jgi:tetratricopeptide (TPR) repeat protein
MDLRTKVIRTSDRDPQKEYAAAQERFSAHLASLKAAGKTAEATSLQARVQNISVSSGLSDKLDAAMQAGAKANSERRWDEALKFYQGAVDLAEKIQPHDSRLITALDHVGNENLKQNPAAAQAAFEQELKVSEEVYGPQTPGTTPALQSLGNNAMVEQDYEGAAKYYFRAVDINEKAFGEGSDAVAESLRVAATAYLMEKDYAKAEPYFLRALRTEESLHGNDSMNLVPLLGELSYLYDGWAKPEKAEPYYHQTLNVIEKQYGENSPVLETLLTKDAAELRSLGKSDEADALDKRLATIRAATMKTN